MDDKPILPIEPNESNPTVTPPNEHRSFTPPKRPKRNNAIRTVIKGIVITLLLVAIGAGLYWQFARPKPATKPSTSTTAPSTQSTTTQESQVATKSYDSTNFSLSFNYPEKWTVADTTGTTLTITSPATQLTDATSKAVTGQIVTTVQQKGQLPPGLGAGDALAVLSSQRVSYTQPTSSQRGQTYLSFLQYSATTAAGGLDGIYITGDYGYQKAQTIPKSDIANIDPLVTVTFLKCSDANCAAANKTALTVAATSWQDSAFSAPIKTLLTSFAFN